MSGLVGLLILLLVAVYYESLINFSNNNNSPILGISLFLEIAVLIILFVINNKYNQLKKQYIYENGKRDMETKIRNLIHANNETKERIKILGEELREKRAELIGIQEWIDGHSEFKGGVS